MSNYILSCCSTADMPKKFFDDNNIPYLCFHYNMDGVEYADDLGQSMSFDIFYQKIAEGSMPTTSQVNVNQYTEFFESFLNEGKDILHVSLSSGLSGSYNSACIAAQELLKKYPERDIRIVDSLGASGGYGLLMAMAIELKNSEKSLDELHTWLEENKLNVHHWFFSTDLTSYYRGGRISKTSQVFGTMLNICPLLNMDNLGRLIPRSKYRGKKRITNEIVARMIDHSQNGTAYSGKCFITHSACPEEAGMVADLVRANFPNLKEEILINSIGTVIGSHTGPGTVALFFMGDKRID